jgi:hypothetical protein
MYSVKHNNDFYSISGNKFRSFWTSSDQRYTKFKNTGYMYTTYTRTLHATSPFKSQVALAWCRSKWPKLVATKTLLGSIGYIYIYTYIHNIYCYCILVLHHNEIFSTKIILLRPEGRKLAVLRRNSLPPFQGKSVMI